MIDKELVVENIEKFINGETDDYIPGHDSDANVVESAIKKIPGRRSRPV